MNTKQAKAEPLPEFLGRLGYAPVQVRGNDVWYRSPFRPNERTPSFKIDRERNIWYDHGVGQGGTIIDFVGALYGTTDISRILTIIADALGSPAQAMVSMPSPATRPKAPPIIESVSDISDTALEAYLRERAIPIDLARLYLKQVGYRVGDHAYRALGFENDAGGFEVRNAAFKGSIGTKDITTFAREGSASAAVFEGFFDFLSVLTHYGRDRAQGNVMVLNSLSMLPRGIELMKASRIARIHAYLDHDEAGVRGLQFLAEQEAWQVLDASPLYAGFKDANEFLAARQGRGQGRLFNH
jgi:hypothetical protein